MGFSWKQAKLDAISHQIRREKQLAKNQQPDFKLKHPGESRDAAQGNYTQLTKRVKEKMEKFQALAQQRRDKRK